MSMKQKINANGERLLLLWGGPGEAPLDDDGLWHTQAEFNDLLAEMAEVAAIASNGFNNAAMIGRIYARFNGEPAGAPTKRPTPPEELIDLPAASHLLQEHDAIYDRYNAPKAHTPVEADETVITTTPVVATELPDADLVYKKYNSAKAASI